MFSVLQIGHCSNLSILLHSTHIAIWPQLQNKTLGGSVRHITHSSDLNELLALIIFFSSLSSSISSSSSPSYNRVISITISKGIRGKLWQKLEFFASKNL